MDNQKGLHGESTIAALQRCSYILAFMMLGFGLMFLTAHPHIGFTSIPRPIPVIMPSFFGIDIWDIIFPVCAGYLTWRAKILQKVNLAHIISAGVWGVFGLLWCVGGMFLSYNFFFGVGLLAMFIAALHVTISQVWFFEGVQ